ncbi:hypothetical protein Ancab_019948 [Ancistrocladus abbreviatus]
MASIQFSAIFLGISLINILPQPTQSLSTCKEHKFTNNRTFESCTDLPHHNAFLHWTYDAAKSTLSMAFTAMPATPEGWIAWAINPTGSGMVGSQALVAFKQKDDSMTVKTSDIKSYHSVQEGPLSFNVSDMSAEFSEDCMMIFATWALPEKTETVNQVWQVGPKVTNGKPERHDLQDSNLASKGKLSLLETVRSSVAIRVSDPPVGAAAPSPEAGRSGGSVGISAQALAASANGKLEHLASNVKKSDAGVSLIRMTTAGFYGILLFGGLAFL